MNELNDLEKLRNGSGAVADIKVNGNGIKKIKPTITMKETVYDPTEEAEKSQNTLKQVELNDEIKSRLKIKQPEEKISASEVQNSLREASIIADKQKEIKELAKSILPFVNENDAEKAAAKAIEKAIVFENTWSKVWENKSE